MIRANYPSTAIRWLVTFLSTPPTELCPVCNFPIEDRLTDRQWRREHLIHGWGPFPVCTLSVDHGENRRPVCHHEWIGFDFDIQERIQIMDAMVQVLERRIADGSVSNEE